MKMSESSDELRVCSYNIHKGLCAANRRPIIRQLRQLLQALDADLMFLQEVRGPLRRPGVADTADFIPYYNANFNANYRAGSVGKMPATPTRYRCQSDYLAESHWPHYVYGRNAISRHSDHGNAILSKDTLSAVRNIDVSQWWFSRRGLLIARLRGGVYLVCVHLGLLAVERRRQLSRLQQLLDENVERQLPLIIAGDFNDWTGAIHRTMLGQLNFEEAYSSLHGGPAKTFPARFPALAMDRIYYRNLQLIDAGLLNDKPWRRLSDHCGLYARFARPAAAVRQAKNS